MQENKIQIEFNNEFRKALSLMEDTKKHIFVTGKAGTGKSTLLSHFRSTTKKKIAVLAPTGVAALNVEGQTMHSFFGFKPNVSLSNIKKLSASDSKVYKELDAIVIDEASMVRADLLDCVDLFLKINGKEKHAPFGGLQMIFIGDLYQLPPVINSEEQKMFRQHYLSPYFFDSRAFGSIDVEFIELEKVYRQRDVHFIRLLNAIRNNTVSKQDFEILNWHVEPTFKPDPKQQFITLTTTNDLADKINSSSLAELKGEEYTYAADVKGKFSKEYFPTNLDLHVKTGSQVMLLNNDSQGRWVNGSMGRVVSIDYKDECISVELSTGGMVEVSPFKWEIYSLSFDKATNSIKSDVVGSFKQYPMRLAWAVTIHKSQGKTFDNVIIDLGRGTFAHGQLYVALSRCRSLAGIVLRKPVEKAHVFMDWRVVKFVTGRQYLLSEKLVPLEQKIALIKKAISSESALEIVYLKATDEKSKRIIMPTEVGEMTYLGKKYIGLKGFCTSKKDERVFRVDRILEISDAPASM